MIKKLLLTSFLLLSLMSLIGNLVFAQYVPLPEPTESFLGCSPNLPLRLCIVEIFLKILKLMLLLVMIFAVLYIVYAGIEYITGGEEKVSKAKSRIIYAVVGLIVAFIAWVGVRVIIRSFSSPEI